jgi:hypothetical protein
MTNPQPRVTKGVPAGGEFSATAHSDEVPDLAAKPARVHDPERHRKLQTQAGDRRRAMDRILKEHDQLSVAELASAVLRDYPDADNVRVRIEYTGSGRDITKLTGIRDAAGTDLTAGVEGWAYRHNHQDDPSLNSVFKEIRQRFFDLENDLDYDPESREIIVPLHRDYAEGIDLD